VQEGARGSTAPDLGSGLNTGDSLKNSALDGALSKTSRRASAHGCPVCSMTSCPLATGRRLSALELWMLARRTDASGPSSSPWRTHLARDGNAVRLAMQVWASPMAAEAKGRAGQGRESSVRQLSNQVIPWATPVRRDGDGGGSGPGRNSLQLRDEVRQWATPTRNGNTNRAGLSPTSGDGLRTQAIQNWPTPTAAKASSNRGGGAGRVGPERLGLSRLVYDKAEARTLSARWVEMLMGFPQDWTATDGPPDVGKTKKRGSRRGSRGAAKSRKTPPG